MARRSDHSREELYELALKAATEIVETDGFRALTARNVADAIGYSPGTLYNLFANLDEMIVHLNGRTLDRLHDDLRPSDEPIDTEKELRRLLDGYLGFLETHPNLWNALFEFALPEGSELPEWYARKVAKVLSLIEDALVPLFADTEIDEKAHVARILWASLHGICSLSDAGKLQVIGGGSVRDMAEGLVANFVTGFKVRLGGLSR